MPTFHTSPDSGLIRVSHVCPFTGARIVDWALDDADAAATIAALIGYYSRLQAMY